MAKQTINQGTAPTGAGGDTFRSGSAKLQANDDEIYDYLGDGTNLNKLGTAAFKNTGESLGNVIGVGDFGFGGNSSAAVGSFETYRRNRFIASQPGTTGYPGAFALGYQLNGADQWQVYLMQEVADNNVYFGRRPSPAEPIHWSFARTTANTTVDGNGFIKNASPIVKLFADKIELNDEAGQQNITFEKLGVGDYLIKGSLGFAQEGWYVETPKDANGNLLVAVVYEQLENGDISVKTYDYMLNNKGRIVADTETPLDIPEARWIDLRLQELPQPEIEIPEPIAPPDFQPTGLAEAVATVMESYHDTEQ